VCVRGVVTRKFASTQVERMDNLISSFVARVRAESREINCGPTLRVFNLFYCYNIHYRAQAPHDIKSRDLLVKDRSPLFGNKTE
jgi:hypothetical protein